MAYYRLRLLHKCLRISLCLCRRTRNQDDTAYGQVPRIYHSLRSRVSPNCTQTTTRFHGYRVSNVRIHNSTIVCQLTELTTLLHRDHPVETTGRFTTALPKNIGSTCLQLNFHLRMSSYIIGVETPCR